MPPKTVRALLGVPFVERIVERAAPETITVFLGHRFDVDVPGQRSHSSVALTGILEWLRRSRHRLVGIDEVVDAVAGRRAPLGRAVAFTLDDGYEDQADIAEVFERFECPVSIFPMSGFVDGDVVPWWDQLAEIVDRAPPTLRAEWPDGPVSLGTSESRRRAVRVLEERAKAWPPDVRNEAFEALAAAAGTEVPTTPRADGRPLSWDQARALERGGFVRFGPHTVSHPVLRVLDDASAATEIHGSCERLRHELAAPLRVFCYPNGRAIDFSEREVRVVREAGCVGALVGEVGYANAGSADAYRIARIPLPADVGDAARWVTGFEALAAHGRTRRKRAARIRAVDDR